MAGIGVAVGPTAAPLGGASNPAIKTTASISAEFSALNCVYPGRKIA